MFLQNTVLLNVALIAIFVADIRSTPQEEEISRWINELGDELWNLGKTITKFSEIEGTYKFLNAQVEKKDPMQLLSDIVSDIEIMMDRKMDAVKCITQKAEEVSEQFHYNKSEPMTPYFSSKWSSIIGEPPQKLPPPLLNNSHLYLKFQLDNDTHFHNLAVNTTHSSVHVPTNIFDLHKDASVAIQWSEALDEVFKQNYKSDPALSWQYFGSSSGIMRHYPAMKWEEIKKDTFDCRVRTWFIEAATCTKDVVILFDSSGSMDGMGKHIAALTTYSILDTLSNNDFINVLNYSTGVNYTIPCFEGMLVQATPENIHFFKNAIQAIKPQGKTVLATALPVAFELLQSYREKRGCHENSSLTCNQAIMIITDFVSDNQSDVVMKYNFLSNGTRQPVRIFTYLIGRELMNVPEISWMSCANRGYYTPVQSLEQVTASVLKYINVIARPLVLQVEEHPASWTHAYVDLTYNAKNDNMSSEPYRLLTSVAVPAYDTQANKNNEKRFANLLGVAGTDVPLNDIQKLTMPYKVGVNAYAFIVSNNGYVLMHPALRPVFQGKLTKNYNSIDLLEVEQYDNDLPARQVDDILLQLRYALVNGYKGSVLNVSIKYHYDKMRRVTRENYDYYFSPIKNSPFSMAIALPENYGNYSLDVGDEITKNRHTGAKLEDFFEGDNWKIHPKWVYCRYRYLEGHEFKTPELELRNFLREMYNESFKWEMQYELEEDEESELDHVLCGRKTHDDDDYYCDRQLVQRLIFDAKNTIGAFRGPWVYKQGESYLFERFNATLRFVATMSGLTRWEYMSEELENLTKNEFGDIHAKAIDEYWYKSAVIQRQFDNESFVYAVPFDSGLQEDLLVTASYAIFPSDAGLQTPGCVVGFQFAHKNFKKRVYELTAKLSNQCPECGTCNTTLDCYVLDASGYILVSGNDNDTGKFFGEIEGDIMDSLLSRGIYEKVVAFDFQALCNIDDDKPLQSAAYFISKPLDHITSMINWIFLKFTWMMFEFSVYDIVSQIHAQDYEDTLVENETISEPDFMEEEEDDETVDESKYYGCEKERDLFVLNQLLFTHDNYPCEISSSRPYYIKKIPYSNMVFIAINSTMPIVNEIKYTTAMRRIVYDNDTVYPCQKKDLNGLPRKRLAGCFNEHSDEKYIKECGYSGASTLLTAYSTYCVFIIYLLLTK